MEMIRFSRILQKLACHNWRNYITKTSPIQMQILSKRTFHRHPSLCAVIFLQNENKYAYGLMESKGYSSPLVSETMKTISVTAEQFDSFVKNDWSKADPKELVKVFSMLATYSAEHNIQISHAMFDSFIDHLTDNIRFLADKDLELLFYSLATWPETESIRTRNYIEVWAALDDECLKRLLTWTFDEQLHFVSLFFMINAARASDFVYKSMIKMASKAKTLTPGQFVQTLFYIGVQRKQPYDMHNLEVHLNNNFSKFTVDDLAIISMGLFKSKTPIRDLELVTKIAQKVIEHASDINEVTLAAILKIIRYSMKFVPKGNNIIYDLLDKMQHETPRLSVMCNVHLALLGSATLTFHQECLDKIAQTIINYLSKARVKDLERLVLTYGTFNYKPLTKECFFTKVINELQSPERKEEIELYGRSYACCIAFLGLLGIYHLDLMDRALEPKFLLNTYGKHSFTYGRETLTIHSTAEIFYKDAEMNRLTDKDAKILAKKYTDYVPSENHTKQYNVSDRMFLDVYKTLQELRGGEDFVLGDHILTHHQRGDIILCNNHYGEPLPVQGVFNSKDFGLIKKVPDKNHWIVLVIAGRNSIIRGTDSATGQFYAKLRELRALGYHAALIPFTVYSELNNFEEKCEYLNNIIKEAVK